MSSSSGAKDIFFFCAKGRVDERGDKGATDNCLDELVGVEERVVGVESEEEEGTEVESDDEEEEEVEELDVLEEEAELDEEDELDEADDVFDASLPPPAFASNRYERFQSCSSFKTRV